MNDYIIDEIKNKISMKELLSYYGIEINKRGFIKCPFHQEKTASVKIYDGDKGFYCFGCGAGGDVIDFVQQYFNLNFKQALVKINQDFNLGLPINDEISQSKKIEIEKRAYKRKQQIKKQKEAIKQVEDRYWAAFDVWLYNHNQIQDNMPQQGQGIPEKYVVALNNIDLALFELEQEEDNRRRVKNEHRISQNP